MFSTKVEMFNERSRETGELTHWLADLNSAGLMAVKALEKSQQSLSDACHYCWLKSLGTTTAIDQFYSVEHRQMITTCQALTAVASALAHRFWTEDPNVAVATVVTPALKVGLLICFNCYLTCMGGTKSTIVS